MSKDFVRRKRLARTFVRALHKKFLAERMPPLAVFNLDHIGSHVFVNGYYEPKQLRCVEKHILPKLSNLSLFLDIGANIGNHTAFFAPHFATVKSYEPNPRTAKLLEANAMLFPNVTAYSFGLSDSEATLQASFSIANVGSASISNNEGGENTVQFKVQRLDTALDAGQRSSVAMIKIDVEGHEASALKGAIETLKLSSPVVLFEANLAEIKDGKTEAMSLLEEYGYQYFYYLQDQGLIASLPRRWSKFFNALSILLTGTDRLGNFVPKLVKESLPLKNHSMIIASKKDLAFE